MMVDIAIAAISSFRIWDNRDWEYEYWSTGCEELFGYTVQELMADKNLWLSQVVPEDRETIVIPMFDAFFAKRNATGEYRFNHKDGSVRWISSNYACQKIEGNSWTIAGVHQDISDTATATLRDRKQAEAEARQTEAEFRAMFNLIGVGMAQVGIKTRRILRANAAFCQITGYSEAELLALTVDDLNHPEDCDLLHRDSYQSEKRYLRKDGSAIDVEVTVSAFMDAGKQFNLVLIKDITEVKRLEALRQQAETAVQQSHQQMLAIWESITDAYTMLDLEWRIVYANRTSMGMLCQLANLEPEEILGKTHWELFPWTVGHTIEREYRRAMAQQVPVHLEVLYEPSGNWFEIHAYPSPVGLGLYFRDISDRKQLEIALQTSEEKLRLALDLNTIGIWEWNIATGVVFWNASHYTVLGYQPGEFEPSYQRWRDRVHPEDIEFAEQRIIQALETHTDYEAELRLLLDDGSIRWLHSKGRAIYDEEAKSLRMIGVEYDITDRKQAEAALRENEQLLRLGLAGAQAGSWDWELATGKLTWSPEMYHLYGLDRDRIDPASDPVQYDIWYNNYLHPDDRQRVSDYLASVWEQRLSEIQIEHRIFHPERGFRWLFGLGRLTVNDRGEPVRFNGITLDISDRKQTELALQESEQRLSLFVKCAPVSVAMFDHKMNYIAVSQRWVDIYHLGSIPEVIGRSHYELLPTIPDRWRLVHQQGLEGFIQRCDEDSFTLPDGSLQWLRWEVQPWEMASGEVGGILIFVEDITDRKQAELMRQQQIEREQAIADIAQDIRRSLDLNEVLSRTVERVRHLLNTDRVIIFRFRPDWQGDVVVESVGAEWVSILSTTIFDPCFEEHYIEPYRQGQISSMSDIDAEHLEPCYVELLKPFQVKANLVIPLLPGEQLWGLLIAHQCSAPRQWQNAEIELLKQLANQVSIAIQQSELYQKIREQAALIDIATDAIFVRDLDNNILFWNQGSERLYGWTAAEVLGKTANELFNEESTSQLAENLQIAGEKGLWQGELEQVTKSGKEIRVASRWTLVRDESGQTKFILVVNSDITEKKQLEKQFYRAQRLESIGTLASGIAHDLNNILTPILTVSHLLPLKFRDLDEQTKQMLEILESSANRGASLVKQVLSFSRGQEGQRVILQIKHLLSEVINIANRTFSKSIQISANIPRMELWTISADATQIHQVLMNLIVNARDAMPNGGSLTISAENRYLDENYAAINLEAQVGFYVIVSISDTGMGIPPELLERIFDPFFTTKEVGQGTGLGLATVMGIVKNHGGFVRVYSEMGNGTQFQVYLPASEERLSQPILEEKLPIGNGELILIVDDEATIRQIAKTSLEKYNYTTLFASDGIEALALYAQHQKEISVVLIDMMMPNLDGLTTIRAMQIMNPQVRAIATSGLAANSQLALSVNVKTFLLKPYTLEELLNALHEAISTTNSQTD